MLKKIFDDFPGIYGSSDRAERCCPYCGWNESSFASQLYYLYSGKYAAGTYYLLFCKKSTGMGCGQAGHRQVLYLLPGKRT